MTWTNPSTPQTGDFLTAALWWAMVRDNFKAIGDPWTPYNPQWKSATTQPNIGNGSIVGSFISAGKLTFWRWKITSGTTTTYGTGNYTITTPVTALSAFQYAHGVLTGFKTPTFFSRSLISVGSGDDMAAIDPQGVRWSPTDPFTPAAATAGQVWSGYGFYEAA